MRPLSAADAITPAWNHTVRLLPPRNWRLLVKIGLVAVFAQIAGLSINTGGPGKTGNMGHMPGLSDYAAPFMAVIAALAALIVIACLIFGMFMFYLGSRLQFVLFDIVLRRDTTVGPIWSRYGAATWRWMGLRLLFILAAILVISPFLIPAIVHVIHMMPSAGTPPANVASFFFTFFSLFAMFFFVAFVLSLISILLHDFGLPSMALESTPMKVTVTRVLGLVRAEPGQIVLYLLFRFLMGLAGGIVAGIAVGILALVACIPAGIVGAILFFLLHHVSVVLMVILLVLLGLLYLAIILGALFSAMGYVITFLQAYALYFLGGRYPMLGAILEPTPVIPVVPTYAMPLPVDPPPAAI